jgi:hypothetical protein
MDMGVAIERSILRTKRGGAKAEGEKAMTRRHAATAVTVLVMVVAALLAAGGTSSAQTTDEGVWTAVSMRGRVSADAPWRWNADTLARSRDGVETLDFLYQNVVVGRDVTGQLGVAFGYAFAAGFLQSGTLFEHRVIQQVTWGAGRRTRVSVRGLVEERVITDLDLRLRLRQQVRVAWPIDRRGRLKGIVSEEVLVQAVASAFLSPALDGNRLFIGIGRPVTPRSTIEIGYLNVFTGGSHSQRSHVLSASLAVTM